MPAPKRHRLVKADLRNAYNWYEDQLPGMGREFREEFRHAYRKTGRNPLIYSVRFSNIRRVNLDRFPYGVFYTVHRDEIRALAVLHGSRETKELLAGRRRTFFENPF